MRGNVTTFVITVDSDVETHKLIEGLIVAESKKVGQIPRVILSRVNGWDLALAIDVTEDTTGNVREFGNTREHVTYFKKVQISESLITTYRSIESSKTGPQYSFLEIPSEYALANAELWLS